MKISVSAIIAGTAALPRSCARCCLALLFAACGPQDPSFTESAVTTAGGSNSLDPVSAATSSAATSSAATSSADGTAVEIQGPIDFSNEKADMSDAAATIQLVRDSFVQQATSKVDILWVVDSSGSMQEEQSYLGQNFASFISQVAKSNADFQIGVTTTDVCDDQDPSLVSLNLRRCPTPSGTATTHLRGSLVGQIGQKVLSRTTSNLENKFTTYSNVGINGSGYEHGLTAAKMAIEKSLAGQNENLVRKDAFLAVIVVSDEEDDGIGLGMTDAYSGQNYIHAGLTDYRYTTDDFIRDIHAAKGIGKFSVSAITGTRLADGSMCTSAHSKPLEEGTQYIQAAQGTGGIVQSICDTNWSASLSAIGQDIAAQSSQLILNQKPYSSAINVFVNSVPSTHWTYNPANNAIKFDVGFVPKIGEKIEIQYETAN